MSTYYYICCAKCKDYIWAAGRSFPDRWWLQEEQMMTIFPTWLSKHVNHINKLSLCSEHEKPDDYEPAYEYDKDQEVRLKWRR